MPTFVTSSGFEASRLARIASIEDQHFWFVARRRLVQRLLEPVVSITSGSTLAIDVGCGTGTMALSLASQGAKVLATDLHVQGLARLTAAARGWAVRADAMALPIPDRTFDLAVALDVLEHADDQRVMAEIARVLKPGGSVVITVPALGVLWSSRDVDAGHRRRYSKDDVVRLLRHHRLELIELRFYQCLLLPLVLLTRYAGRRWRGSQTMEEQPPAWLNRICLAINNFEIAAGAALRWPVGSSLAVVAQKPSGS